ncbi:MAG: alpha/beta fold hydrolase [Actinomycetes bacterium]
MTRTTHRLPGLVVTEHELTVPLDHDRPGESITLFAREVVAPRKRDQDLPWLLFLQGGPGMRGPRPTNRSSWLGRALLDHRVLLLDQRGTGRSTPQTRQSLSRLGSPEAQARQLMCFRADSIVRDAELVRRELIGDRRWTVLGQSFGGFAALTYLSFAPEGLREVLVTGGLPPLDRGPDDVYRATSARVHSRWRRWIDRYPQDSPRFDAIADRLARDDVRLPSGDPFTVPRLQQLGMVLGYSDGFERLHYLLETAWSGDELSDEFLVAVETATSFVEKPLYALLHEPIYCLGDGRSAHWSAQRVRDKSPELAPDVRPLQPTGEMIYPWMFQTDRTLAPLAGAAEILAAYDGWPPLYDIARLAANRVPVAAAIYHDDMYVEYAYSLESAQQIGHCQWWVTSEFGHDGLRSDARVLDRLLAMNAGDV